MNELTKDELELRKWALEISLKHGCALFPIGGFHDKQPWEIFEDAEIIIELVTKWDKQLLIQQFKES